MKYIFILAGLVLSLCSYGQATWTATAGPFGGNVDNLRRAPNGTLYAVLSQRLYKSANNGDSWTAVVSTNPSSFFLNDIYIDANGDFYAVYFSNFYKSTDDGDNWELINSTQIQSARYLMAVGPDKVFVVWGFGGLFVSIDKGVNWTQLTNLGWSGTPGCWANSAGDIFYGVQGGKILRHTYQGLTSNWSSSTVQELTNYETASGATNIATMIFDTGGRMYAASFFEVFTSDTNGDSFTSITANLNAQGLSYFDGLLAGSPDNSVYFFASTDENLYKTTDQGANWSVSAGPSKDYGTDVRTIAFASASTIFVGTTGDGVFRTNDTAASWQFKSSGLTGTNASGIVVSNTNRIMLIKNANSYWSSTNGGSTWQINVMNDFIRGGLKLSDGTIVLYGSKVFRSTDHGATFNNDGIYYYHTKIHEASSGDLYGFSYGKISKSTDKGINWTDLVVTGYPANLDASFAAVDASDNIMVYGWNGSVNKLYLIVGLTATEVTTNPVTGTFSVNNVFTLDGKFYVSEFSSHHFTSDLGANWTTVGFSGDKVLPLQSGPYTGLGVSKSGSLNITQDGGNTWNNTISPTGAVITDIAVDTNGDFYASANQSSVLKFTNDLLVDPATLPPYIDFNWQSLNGPYGGNIRRLVAHPDGNTLFAIANGFILWRYKDGLWSKLAPIPNVPTIYDVAMDAAGNLYLTPGMSPQKIYTSVDKGDTWTPLPSTGLPASGIVSRLIEVLSDGSIIAFGNSGGFGRIYKSSDGGATFTEKYTSSENVIFNLLPVLPAKRGGNVAAMGHKIVGGVGIPNEGLLVSTNFGDTWTAKSLSTIASATGFIGSLAYDSQGSLVATSIIDSSISNWVANLSKSTNNGDTWNVVTTPGPITSLSYGKRFVVLPDDTYLLTLQNPFFDLYKSTDHGASWSFVSKIGDIFLTTANQGSNVYVGGNIKGVQKTTDGSSFIQVNNGMPINFSSDIEILDNTHLIVGATSPYYSSDFGQNLSLASSEVAGNFLLTDDAIIAYGSKNLQRSTDGGATWSPIGDDRYFGFLATDIAGNGYYAFSNSEIPGTTVEFGLFFSTDLLIWTKVQLSGLPENFSVGGMVIDEEDVIYALIFDNDLSQNKIYKIPFGSGTDISADIGVTSPSSIKYFNGKILVYDASGKLFKSPDGLTWTQGTAPAGLSLIVANDYLFISANNTVLWVSRDEGQSWQSVGDAPESSVVFRDIAINEFDGYAYAAMQGSVIRKSGNIVIPNDNTNPVAAALSPVPNASGVVARPNLTITFDEATSKVANKKIRVFDVAQPALPVEVLDASSAVRNGKSYVLTLSADLSYLKTYFVVIDPGAFKDIHGNEYVGISSSSAWRFTIQEEPDTQKPTISVTTTSLNLQKGQAKNFEIQVTDNKILPTDKTTIKYRGIADLDNAPFGTAIMTVLTGGGTASTSFSIGLQEQWFDEMGLEFYFESEDASGNVQRSPEALDQFLYSYIQYPTEASPIVPAGRIAFGGSEASYRIVSIPFELADAQISTVFDELGTYDKTKWRSYTYAGNNQFTENPTSFERGRGYWINVRNSPGSIAVEGSTTPANNRKDFFTMNLNPGWNQIGNPYPVDISWEQTRAADANVGEVKIYNGTAYSNGDILLPYQGGFVFLNGASPVSLKVRFKDILSGGRTRDFGSDLSKTNWIVPISVSHNNIKNDLGGIGMHENAVIDLDQYDDINPPRFLDYAELNFIRQNDYNLPLALDMVPADQEFVWSFSVEASDGPTTLKWDELVITGDKDLILMDEAKQNLVDMQSIGSYNFIAPESRDFKIFFGTNIKNKIGPTRVILGKPYPNPSAQVSFIQYTIPESKTAYIGVIEVYDTMGKKVSTIKSGDFEPGFHTLEWDSSSQSRGVYYIRFALNNGQDFKSLTERIILNR